MSNLYSTPEQEDECETQKLLSLVGSIGNRDVQKKQQKPPKKQHQETQNQ